MDTDDGVADKHRRSSRKTMATRKDEGGSEVRRRSSRQTMKSPSPTPEASKRLINGPKAAAVVEAVMRDAGLVTETVLPKAGGELIPAIEGYDAGSLLAEDVRGDSIPERGKSCVHVVLMEEVGDEVVHEQGNVGLLKETRKPADVDEVMKVCPADAVGDRAEAPFRVIRVGGLYENLRNGDCGPKAVKFLEMHSTGDRNPKMAGLTYDLMDIFRKHYAMDIYKGVVVPLYLR
ncbi:hypothetical protein IGI04_027257 [Brassica rapa subsp. trilocularis]|uniref:Ubiquitin-like protease family profile domain-containing protein n=1 Tax=Brassica rapa subsp. trilocularis TaxID=1813537 RepID=A0ABQ7L0T3_BRACM|nr:hypothetical protein IGI04_027257 [Brassica rapa subsp. trilocularis]